MKLVTLLAGVAAVALTAGTASAQVGSDIRKGEYTDGLNQGHVRSPGDTSPNNILATNAVRDLAQDGSATRSAWFAEGNAVDNIGQESNSDSARFTLTGAVTTDCAYYSGENGEETLDFGEIGIYASDDTGPAAAFRMVSDANVSIDTNLAGCNTANRVTIQKNDVRGMVNNAGVGYDTDVFQANLPYQVTASYKASGTGAPAQGTNQTWTVATGADQGTRSHGAWKSAMSLDVLVPRAPKALLAGTYTGSFTVTIAAGI